MRAFILLPLLLSGATLLAAATQPSSAPDHSTAAGWVKYRRNPVLGGNLGTCFDVSVLHEDGRYWMWFSWRPKRSIGLVESPDGFHWGKPTIVLAPNPSSGWEEDINRPAVLKVGGRYRMWYTGQAHGHSWIGYATSADGRTWSRVSKRPVLSPEQPWEKVAVMCPDVLYDRTTSRYKMWYSGGEQYEPNAIGYATSSDGLHWTRGRRNPVFEPEPKHAWEKDRVTACHLIRRGGWYIMFYIGFHEQQHAQIGAARSRDGVTGWQRHPANPIVRPSARAWDADAVYKPFALFDGRRWLLWYNGRRDSVEQIGVALHEGRDLGF
ncbi:MAG TPA: family 43 glycosylhydrolase [Gemmataceae bacterium]|nr:family 43 glycosylhydrolase [Gemmataceae bacterium]